MAEKWETKITKVEPDNLLISGYPLQELVEKKTLLDVAHLLVSGELPDVRTREQLRKTALQAVMLPAPPIARNPKEDISKSLEKCLLLDDALLDYPDRPTKKTAFALGRVARYLAHLNNTEKMLDGLTGDEDLSLILFRIFTGRQPPNEKHSRLLEAMITACVDHGVTPPSAQATIIASSVRASYEVSIAHGVGAITDVHGGAGAKAALFFRESIQSSADVKAVVDDYQKQKKRIPGLGHRVHKNDPRRDVLWRLAKESGVAGRNVEMSMKISAVFKESSGKDLPINVDGVIGAIVADFGLDVSAAKTIFIIGRVAGLSAHHYEEYSRPQMRQIGFEDAIYTGKSKRSVPGGVA
ncbi:MAG: citrate/2-methylcitrate synthase [Thermoplasmata archaeon]|nr:citrate/2-methylcitrate synthase [Thermoplasmata archaeon]